MSTTLCPLTKAVCPKDNRCEFWYEGPQHQMCMIKAMFHIFRRWYNKQFRASDEEEE